MPETNAISAAESRVRALSVDPTLVTAIVKIIEETIIELLNQRGLTEEAAAIRRSEISASEQAVIADELGKLPQA